jgi:hypothetical protein
LNYLKLLVLWLYYALLIQINFAFLVFHSVLPYDECCDPIEHEHFCARTLPVGAVPSCSPPPPEPSMRHQAMEQLRPVSLPDVVKDMAGKDPLPALK